MSVIDLDLSELETLYNNLKTIESELQDHYRKVSNVLNTLDMKVASRREIDDSLGYVKRCLKNEKNYIAACATFTKCAIDSFRDGDNISGQLPEYDFHMNNVNVNPGIVYAEALEKIQLEMVENAEQLLAQGICGSATTDAADYLEFLQQSSSGLKIGG